MHFPLQYMYMLYGNFCCHFYRTYFSCNRSCSCFDTLYCNFVFVGTACANHLCNRIIAAAPSNFLAWIFCCQGNCFALFYRSLFLIDSKRFYGYFYFKFFASDFCCNGCFSGFDCLNFCFLFFGAAFGGDFYNLFIACAPCYFCIGIFYLPWR